MPNFISNLDIDEIMMFLVRILAVFVCIMVHEVSHGLAAYWLGDPTAKQGHRLSLNPIRHIDPIGLLMMIVVGFGWAKPVPVDPRYFKNPKTGMAITAFAGPFSNFILAWIAAAGYNLCYGAAGVSGPSAMLQYIASFLGLVMVLSIGLGLFNLIPFPPLDGSKILTVILPERIYFNLMRYERYGMFVLILLFWSGVLDRPLIATRDFFVEVFLSSTISLQGLMLGILG